MGQIAQNPKNILRYLEFILKQWKVINSYEKEMKGRGLFICFNTTLAFEYIKGWKNEGYIIHYSNLSFIF